MSDGGQQMTDIFSVAWKHMGAIVDELVGGRTDKVMGHHGKAVYVI